MRAEQIMTTPVATIAASATVHEAIELLTNSGVTSAPVLDESGNVVGIVSEVDLLRGRLAHDPRTQAGPVAPDGDDPPTRVRDVMTEPVVCLSAQTDVAQLAEVLVDNRVRAVPILDGGELVGIVSRRDVLRTLLRTDTSISAEVQERLDAYAGSAGRWVARTEQGTVTIDGAIDDNRVARVLDLLARTVPGVVRVHVTAAGHDDPARAAAAIGV